MVNGGVHSQAPALKRGAVSAEEMGMGRAPSIRSSEGFTLPEVMMAAVVLVVGMLGVLTMLDTSNRRIGENRAREAATNLAREVIEGARAVPYPDITPATLEAALKLQPGLQDTSPTTGWNVTRREETYTITVSTCIIDDDGPRDGVGDHTAAIGTFCSDSPTAVTNPPDLNPDDYKRVVVDVQRSSNGENFSVRQTGIINNPGSVFAPSVRTLTAAGLTAPYRVTSSSVTSLSFSALVTPRAAYVPWTVDNVAQGNATGPAVDNWSFTWPIASIPDGVYLIGAKGYNAQDQTGSSKAVSVTLNRFPPTLPATFAAGRNGSVGLEFEWTASPDRDVTAYRVYRMVGSQPSTSDALMCTKSVSDAQPLACIAADVPGNTHRYYVAAVGPACCGLTGQQESTRSPSMRTVLVADNIRPNPPQAVTGSRLDGVATLSWQPPAAPAAGEAGDSIAFYRIYRDGQAVGDRYGRADANATSFVDAQAVTGSHVYWVTAVDTHMRESEPVGGFAL